MDIEVIVNSLFAANTYIVIDGGRAVIIDPGSSVGEQVEAINSRGLEPVAVLATHGHIDHIIGAYDICSKYDIPFYIHKLDSHLLSMDEVERIRIFIGDIDVKMPTSQEYMEEGELEIGGFSLHIIHTPGHTMGSVCIRVAESVFTGDTIFRESVGRTDFGGDLNHLIDSIHRKLFSALDSGTILYPGHGPPTTIGHEIKNNPFVGIRGIYPFRLRK